MMIYVIKIYSLGKNKLDTAKLIKFDKNVY